ncbi:GNAT family N-acetyltransferase [Ideonella sp. BN130291]|uniref:GNAT family N-acetyltransferase n=1 Tax=Ideonella sp. BN130291 TaxID=3112940 RepID=UPI002E26EE0C|nr:GNAT family N-acetyltransferase [Ideonella sp. BN130291]
MSAVLVRQAVVQDIPALAALVDQYRQFQGQPADPMAAQAFLRERFDHGESVVFLAAVGAEPAGFAQLYPLFSTVALRRAFILNDLFVGPAWRRLGVATRLLEAVEAHGHTMQAVRLSLNVARNNPAAQQLYRERGWCEDQQFLMFNRSLP